MLIIIFRVSKKYIYDILCLFIYVIWGFFVNVYDLMYFFVFCFKLICNIFLICVLFFWIKVCIVFKWVLIMGGNIRNFGNFLDRNVC